MSIFNELFKLESKELKRYSVMNEDNEEEGVEWLIQFQLASDEFDDSFDQDYKEEVVIVAPDFDTAYKYAQQYVRKMQLDSETSAQWKGAEIVSVDKR